jgi:uncharacterized SAM-binding protein YcdF (DUF218 family)
MGVTRARRRWPRVLLGAWIAFIVVASTSVALFVRPVVDKPTPSDAIVLFAGGGNRIGLARKLAAENLAPITVVSNPARDHHYDEGFRDCRPNAPWPTPLSCFVPDPVNTRGEARYIAKLANEHGWKSLILVVSDDQALRARLLLERCFSGRVEVVTTPPSDPIIERVAYEWGALARALVLRRDC